MSKFIKWGVYQLRKTIYRTTYIPNFILPWRIHLSVGKKKNAFFYYLATAYLHCFSKLQQIYKQYIILKKFIFLKKKNNYNRRRFTFLVPKETIYNSSLLSIHIEAQDVLDEILDLLFPTVNLFSLFDLYINKTYPSVKRSDLCWFNLFDMSTFSESHQHFFFFSRIIDNFNFLTSFYILPISSIFNVLGLKFFKAFNLKFISRGYLRSVAHKVKYRRSSSFLKFRSLIDVLIYWLNKGYNKKKIILNFHSWHFLMFERNYLLRLLFKYKHRYYLKRKKYYYKIRMLAFPFIFLNLFFNFIYIKKCTVFSFFGLLNVFFFKRILFFQLFNTISTTVHFKLLNTLLTSFSNLFCNRVNSSLRSFFVSASFFSLLKNNNIFKLFSFKCYHDSIVVALGNGFLPHLNYYFFLSTQFLFASTMVFFIYNKVHENISILNVCLTNTVFLYTAVHSGFVLRHTSYFLLKIRSINKLYTLRYSSYKHYIKRFFSVRYSSIIIRAYFKGYVWRRLTFFFIVPFTILKLFFFFYKQFDVFLSIRIQYLHSKQLSQLLKYNTFKMYKQSLLSKHIVVQHFIEKKKKKITLLLQSYSLVCNLFFTVSNINSCSFFLHFLFYCGSLSSYFQYISSLYVCHDLYRFPFDGLGVVRFEMQRKLTTFARRIYSRFYIRRFLPLFFRRKLRSFKTRRFYNILSMNFFRLRYKRRRTVKFRGKFALRLRDQLFDNNQFSSIFLRRLQYYYWSLFHIRYNKYLIRNRIRRFAKKNALAVIITNSKFLHNLDTLNSISMYLLDSYKMSLVTFSVFSLFISQANVTSSFSGLLLFLESTVSFFFFFNFFTYWVSPSSVFSNIFNISNITFFSVGEVLSIYVPWFRDRWICLLDLFFSPTLLASNIFYTDIFYCFFLSIINKLFFSFRFNSILTVEDVFNYNIYKKSYINTMLMKNCSVWLINNILFFWFKTFIKRLSRKKRLIRTVTAFGALISFVKLHDSVSIRFNSLERHFGVHCVRNYNAVFHSLYRYNIPSFFLCFFYDSSFRSSSFDWIRELMLIQSSVNSDNVCNIVYPLNNNQNTHFVKNDIFLYKNSLFFYLNNSLKRKYSIFIARGLNYSTHLSFSNTCIFYKSDFYFYSNVSEFNIKKPMSYKKINYSTKCVNNLSPYYLTTTFYNNIFIYLPKLNIYNYASSVFRNGLFLRNITYYYGNSLFNSNLYYLRRKMYSYILNINSNNVFCLNNVGNCYKDSFIVRSNIYFHGYDMDSISSSSPFFLFPDNIKRLSHIFYFFFLIFFKHNLGYNKIQFSHTLNFRNISIFNSFLGKIYSWKLSRMCFISWPYFLTNVDVNTLAFFSASLRSDFLSYKKNMYSLYSNIINDALKMQGFFKSRKLRKRLINNKFTFYYKKFAYMLLKMKNSSISKKITNSKLKYITGLYLNCKLELNNYSKIYKLIHKQITHLRNVFYKNRSRILLWIVSFLDLRMALKKRNKVSINYAHSKYNFFIAKIRRLRRIYLKKYVFLRKYGMSYKISLIKNKKSRWFSYKRKRVNSRFFFLDNRLVGRAFSFYKYVTFISTKKYSVWIGSFFSLCRFYFSLFSSMFNISESWCSYFYKAQPYKIASFVRLRKITKRYRRKARRRHRRLRGYAWKRRFLLVRRGWRLNKRKKKYNKKNLYKRRNRHYLRVIRIARIKKNNLLYMYFYFYDMIFSGVLTFIKAGIRKLIVFFKSDIKKNRLLKTFILYLFRKVLIAFKSDIIYAVRLLFRRKKYFDVNKIIRKIILTQWIKFKSLILRDSFFFSFFSLFNVQNCAVFTNFYKINHLSKIKGSISSLNVYNKNAINKRFHFISVNTHKTTYTKRQIRRYSSFFFCNKACFLDLRSIIFSDVGDNIETNKEKVKHSKNKRKRDIGNKNNTNTSISSRSHRSIRYHNNQNTNVNTARLLNAISKGIELDRKRKHYRRIQLLKRKHSVYLRSIRILKYNLLFFPKSKLNVYAITELTRKSLTIYDKEYSYTSLFNSNNEESKYNGWKDINWFICKSISYKLFFFDNLFVIFFSTNSFFYFVQNYNFAQNNYIKFSYPYHSLISFSLYNSIYVTKALNRYLFLSIFPKQKNNSYRFKRIETNELFLKKWKVHLHLGKKESDNFLLNKPLNFKRYIRTNTFFLLINKENVKLFLHFNKFNGYF